MGPLPPLPTALHSPSTSAFVSATTDSPFSSTVCPLASASLGIFVGAVLGALGGYDS